LFHGTDDYSIPSDARYFISPIHISSKTALTPNLARNFDCAVCPFFSKNFADSLQGAGVKAESILYDGKTHTDLFLQVSKFKDQTSTVKPSSD
ncbi:hypothetical protein, partial [Plesiomonas shigelloides]